MQYLNYKSCKSFQFLANMSIMCLAVLLAVNFSTSVFADNGQVGLNATTKINLGNTEITSNSTAQASVSAGNSGGQTNNGSNENSQANMQSQTNTQAEYNGHYKSSYATMSANSENSFTVDTDKHLYKPGESVKIQGSIWSGLITELGGANLVTVQVLDDKGNVVSNENAQVNGDGQYNAEFTLLDNGENGTYTINTKINVSANLQNSLTLKTQSNLQSSGNFLVASPSSFAVSAEGKDFGVQIASNSQISNIQFDEQAKKISFTVSGQTGTKGTTDITIPKSLLSGSMNVIVDGQVMSQADVIKTADTQDETTLEINYHHSTHTIDIVGTNAVPEFPTSILIMAAAIGVVIFTSTRHPLKSLYKL
jgi:uncharacterized protein YfaS (alpha-2-macroglobulin family)